jgi:hypothetical protein
MIFRQNNTNATYTEFSYFRHFEKKLRIAESKLEISCNIIDDSDISMNCLLTKFTIFKVK